MKQPCYWEEYEGTRANDLNKQNLICKTRPLVSATYNFPRRQSTQRSFTRPQRKSGNFSGKKIVRVPSTSRNGWKARKSSFTLYFWTVQEPARHSSAQENLGRTQPSRDATPRWIRNSTFLSELDPAAIFQMPCGCPKTRRRWRFFLFLHLVDKGLI